MKLAAIFSVLACGVTAAMWLRVSPVMDDTGFASAAGLVAGALVCGVLLDRWSPKAALILGLAMLSSGLWRLILGPSSHLAQLAASCVIAAGAGMVMVSASAVVLQVTLLSHASALAVLNVVLPVGMLCNPVLSPAAISYAAATLATLALAFAIVTPMPRSPESAGDRAAVPGLLPLMLVFALYGIYEGAIWNWLVMFYGTVRILDRNDGWQILSYGVPLGLIVGRIGASRLLANVAPAVVLRVTAVAMAFAAGLMLLARSPSACWAAAFCVGVAMAAVLPAALAVSYDVFPRHAGLGMALVFASGSVGLAGSIPAIDALSARFGLPMAMLLLPAVSLVMAAFCGIRRSVSRVD